MEASFLNRVEVKKNGFGQTADFVTTGNFFPQGKICETLPESFFSNFDFWRFARRELPNALKSAAAVLLGALHSGASAWHQGDLLREKTARQGRPFQAADRPYPQAHDVRQMPLKTSEQDIRCNRGGVFVLHALPCHSRAARLDLAGDTRRSPRSA